MLTVGSQNVTITQPGNSCAYTLDKTSYPVTTAGGAVSAILTATTGCPWAVTNNYSSAVSFTSASSGTGSAIISLSVIPNPNLTARNFSLSVGSTTIRLAQAAVLLTAQTITFGAIGNQMLGATVPALSATATSGLLVTFY